MVKLAYTLEHEASPHSSIVYSPDGSLFLTHTSDETYVWDATRFTLQYKVPGKIESDCFSADGRYFLSQQNRVIRVFWLIETATGEIVKKINLQTFAEFPKVRGWVDVVGFRADTYEIMLGFTPSYENANYDDRYGAMAYTNEMKKKIPLTSCLTYDLFTNEVTQKFPEMEHITNTSTHWMMGQHNGAYTQVVNMQTGAILAGFKGYERVTLSHDASIGVGFLDAKPWMMHAFFVESGELIFKQSGDPRYHKIYHVNNTLWWLDTKKGTLIDVGTEKLIHQFDDTGKLIFLHLSPRGNLQAYITSNPQQLRVAKLGSAHVVTHEFVWSTFVFSPDENYLFGTYTGWGKPDGNTIGVLSLADSPVLR